LDHVRAGHGTEFIRPDKAKTGGYPLWFARYLTRAVYDWRTASAALARRYERELAWRLKKAALERRQTVPQDPGARHPAGALTPNRVPPHPPRLRWHELGASLQSAR